MSLAIWDKSKPVNGKNLLLFSSKYLKASESKPEGMKAHPFTTEERARIDDLLKKAETEYDSKAVYTTNMDNYQ